MVTLVEVDRRNPSLPENRRCPPSAQPWDGTRPGPIPRAAAGSGRPCKGDADLPHHHRPAGAVHVIPRRRRASGPDAFIGKEAIDLAAGASWPWGPLPVGRNRHHGQDRPRCRPGGGDELARTGPPRPKRVEAVHTLSVRRSQWTALRAPHGAAGAPWPRRVARKLAVTRRRMWTFGTNFRFGKEASKRIAPVRPHGRSGSARAGIAGAAISP